MASIFIFAVIYAAVAGGLSTAAESRCSLDIAVSYPDGGQPAVSCTSQCPVGEDGFTITGVAYKRFSELDSYNAMIRVSYRAGASPTCSLVPLQSEEELAALYEGCGQADENIASAETTPTTSTAAPVAIRERCLEGFSKVGDSCYLVTPTASSAPAGWQACAQYGGTGAVIETEDEQNRLAGVLSTRVWLALTDEEEEGRFQAPGLSDTRFTRWNNGEPNNLNGDEDCVMLIPEWRFGWNDDNCQVSSRALCEHAPVPVYEEPTCPAGQHKFEDSCYFFTEVGDYDTGAARCSSEGGYPAVLGSQQEQQFLASIATETVYLGITDRAEESVFVSNFGVPLYSNWNYGEPNNWNGDEDCVQMIDGWGDTWYDISCSTWLRTACEVPA